MATTTTYLALRKPATSDLVSVTLDIGANMDTIDSAVNNRSLVGHSHGATAGAIDVTAYGAVGNGTTDDTTAIQNAINDLPSGGTVSFPQGTYKVSALDLGVKPILLLGAGSPGQDASVGNGVSVIKVTGSGTGIKWAVGEASAKFRGCTIRDLHIRADSTAIAGVGVHLGNASNCLLDRVTVSDYTTGTGIKIGDTSPSTGGSQYSTLAHVTVSDCQTGVDLVNSNGIRFIGCFLESNVTTPPAGSIGVKVQSGSDTVTLLGTVMQGWDKCLQMSGGHGSAIGCRFEGWETCAVEIASNYNNVLGGSMNNSINDSVGTGVIVTSGTRNHIEIASIQAVAAEYTDAGTATRIFTGVGTAKLPQTVAAVTATAATVGGRAVTAAPYVFHMNTGLTTDTDTPAALREFNNTTARRIKADLTGTTSARVTVRVSTAGVSGTKLAAQYSTDESTWFYLEGTASASAPAANEYVTIDATGTRASAYATLAAAAKADVFLRLVTLDGDGAADPVVGIITVQVK